MNGIEVSYSSQHKNGGHDCENLAVICMDFRFRKELPELLEQAGFQEFDLVSLPGASKAIIDEKSRGAVFAAIDIAHEKHHGKRIIIVDHIDCGAYGGSGQFLSKEEEEQFHVERLVEAAKLIRAEYPSLEIVTLYADWQHLGSA
jgi:carbonic anhydrase